MKIYELANELAVPSAKVIELIKKLELGAPANHFQQLDEETTNIVRRQLLRESLSSAPQVGSGEIRLPGSSESGAAAKETVAVTSNQPGEQVLIRRKVGKELTTSKKNPRGQSDLQNIPPTLLGTTVHKTKRK